MKNNKQVLFRREIINYPEHFFLLFSHGRCYVLQHLAIQKNVQVKKKINKTRLWFIGSKENKTRMKNQLKVEKLLNFSTSIFNEAARPDLL